MKYPVEVNDRRKINRVSFKQFFIDVVSVFNLERGAIFTIKMLFVNPGQLVLDYLGERRYSIFNPFRLLILTTALSLFVNYLTGFSDTFVEYFEEGVKNDNDKIKFEASLFHETLLDWYNVILWVSIPIYGFFTFILFRSRKFNYAENLVLQTYYLSITNILTIAFLVAQLFVNDVLISWVLIISSTGYFYYFVISFFNQNNWVGWLKTTVALIGSAFIYMLIASLMVGGFLGYTASSN